MKMVKRKKKKKVSFKRANLHSFKKNNHPSLTRWALAKPSSPRFNTLRILDNDTNQKSLIEGGEPLKTLNQTTFSPVPKNAIYETPSLSIYLAAYK